MYRFVSFTLVFFFSLLPISIYAKSKEEVKAAIQFGTLYEKGNHYVALIQEKFPDLLSKIPNDKRDNLSDKTVRYIYKNIGRCSPDLIRYTYYAGMLRKEYGSTLSNTHFVQIGGESVHLCRQLQNLLRFSSYTIIDNDEDIESTRESLNQQGIKNVNIITLTQIDSLKENLLVFSSTTSNETFVKYHKIIETLSQKKCSAFFSYDYQTNDPISVDSILIKSNADDDRNGTLSSTLYDHQNREQINIKWNRHPSHQNTKLNDPPQTIPFKLAKTKTFVSYNLSGGRLGDNLMAYFHAKWISMKYNLPFVVKRFHHIDWFELSSRDHSPKYYMLTKYHPPISSENEIVTYLPSTIFVVPYFPDCKFEYDMLHMVNEKRPFFYIEWDNPKFKREIRECLKPKVTVETIPIPENTISVAMHIRRGGSFENFQETQRGYPLKCPPTQFFSDQLQKIANAFKDDILYVYLFTDDLYPDEIVKEIASSVQHNHIYYDWEKHKKASQNNALLRDFYSIANFDCLIRSTSNFSTVAAKLGDYKIEIYPKHAYFDNDKVVIDETELKFNMNR